MDAQTEGQYAYIELHNGVKLAGKVISVTESSIVVRRKGRDWELQKSQFKSAWYGDELNEVQGRGQSIYSDTYCLLPSARPVGEGNSHYKNYNIFWNQFNFGFSKYFSLGAGFDSASLLFGQPPSIYYLAPKASVGKGRQHFSLGLTNIMTVGEGIGMLSFLNTNYTYGTARANVTVGYSYALTTREVEQNQMVNINVMLPVTDKLLLLSEVAFIDSNQYSINTSLRFLYRSSRTLDVGFMRIVGFEDTVFAPVLSLALPLQKRAKL